MLREPPRSVGRCALNHTARGPFVVSTHTLRPSFPTQARSAAVRWIPRRDRTGLGDALTRPYTLAHPVATLEPRRTPRISADRDGASRRDSLGSRCLSCCQRSVTYSGSQDRNRLGRPFGWTREPSPPWSHSRRCRIDWRPSCRAIASCSSRRRRTPSEPCAIRPWNPSGSSLSPWSQRT